MWFRIGFTVQVGISLVSRGKQNPNLPWYLCIQGYPKKSPWWDGRTFQAYPSESQDSAQAWYPLCYCPSPPTSTSASSRKWFKSRFRPWYFVYWYAWAEFYKTTPSSWTWTSPLLHNYQNSQHLKTLPNPLIFKMTPKKHLPQHPKMGHKCS